jgi:hypothetical protein
MASDTSPSAQVLFDGEYEPSPVPRIRDQVARYEESGARPPRTDRALRAGGLPTSYGRGSRVIAVSATARSESGLLPPLPSASIPRSTASRSPASRLGSAS